MKFSRFCRVVCCALPMLVFVTGCPSGGPNTVPVEGTLTIKGQPANNVTINLVSADPNVPMASGPVQNGSFKLFTGTQGTPGAIPGKYKVVLVAAAGAAPTASMYQQAAAGASRSSPAPTAALPFPDKYKDAATSDEEVEITSGSNTLKIEIP